ncbi:hypothetical protein GQ44DRAFT_633618 [Phaeosphaeriaceae sp. PMI808]|nr:hypothetical protein GQ44DRAFT_633618 [Phaeosphaeriaceae sp. PMI808]
MGAGAKVILVLRVIALVAALAIVGLGAWSKFIIHDVEIRGTAVLRTLQLDTAVAANWRSFFKVATDGTMRIWISIAAGSFAFLTSLLVVLSTVLQRFPMPHSVSVPLELLSLCAMITVVGCALSFTINLNAFDSTELDTSDSTDLTMFTMVISLCRGLVFTAGGGSFLLLNTTITSMVQACLRKRAKESCSFEPTASSLGMGHGYQAIVPPMPSSRPPTLYDPRKPLPKQLDEMPSTEEEEHLVEKISRVDSGLETEQTRPLQSRPSRPWSNMAKQKSPGVYAL